MSGTDRSADDMERIAEMYNRQIDAILLELRNVLDRKHELPQGLTYREGLDFFRLAERLKEAMLIRDAIGTHSQTGRELYRWLAHPNQNPQPTWLEDANDQAPV